MRDFELEVFFSRWEFNARHHMTASDAESWSVADLLAMAGPGAESEFTAMRLGYTETWGAPELRSAIAATYEQMDPANVLCLAGAGEGLYSLARVLLEPGDHVIVPVPNYQSAETVPLTVADVSGIGLEFKPGGRGWQLDVGAVIDAIRPATRLVSLNLPHNPTGMLLPRDDLQALVDACRKGGIYLLCDEVYRGIEVDPARRLPQVADLYERGLSLNVVSKAYGLPGLRVGWLASQDRELLQRVERYKHYLSICNSAPAELLAKIALENAPTLLDRNRNLVARNLGLLETLFDEFPGLIEGYRPQGGCVAFPRFDGPGGGETFCRRLLDEHGVLLLPSSIYRSELLDVSENHFRIGVGQDTRFVAGLAALRQHLETHYGDFRR